MVNKIVYKNERGISIEFNHNGPLFIYSVKGFDGLESDIISTQSAYQEGIDVKGSSLKNRLLTLDCYMLVDTEEQRDYLKRELFKVFNPKLKGTILVSTFGGTTRKGQNIVVVQAPIFNDNYSIDNKLVNLQIQLCMPLPYFEDVEESKADFGNDIGNFFFDLEILEPGNELSIKNNSLVSNIINEGDAEVPIKVVFSAKADLTNPSIFNVYTKEYIKINKSLKAGEIITVTTHKGNKRVESYLDGVTTNIFNYLDIGSTFMWLDVGDNIIRYDSDTMIEQLEVYLYYTNYYLGV